MMFCLEDSMQIEFQPYSNSANLEAIRAIGQNVILEIAPDERLSAGKLMDRIVQVNEQRKVLEAKTSSNEAGSFGGLDLVTLVVVPLIVTTLGEICKQLVIWRIDELKKQAKKNKESEKQLSTLVDIVVEQKYEEISRKVNSEKSRSKRKVILKSTKLQIKKYLEIA
jgi:hypothetical protein